MPLLIQDYLDICDPVLTFDKFMGEIELEKYLKNIPQHYTGRLRYDPVSMLKTVLFGFMANGYISLRELEDQCKVNLRFMYLMDHQTPSYRTFGYFINEVLADSIKEIFQDINKKIFETEHVDLQHLYIDGSKFEANANKYSWVWKKATEKSRYRLFDKITTLFEEINEELSCTGISGLETGEFMFAEEISQDKYSQVESSENTVPQIMDSDVEGMLTFNCGAAPFDDLNARKAVAIGLDLEELGTAQIGDEKFWSLDGCLFDKSTVWYDENAGEGVYAKNDIELAKEYLAKSDYNGEPVVIVQGKDDNVESQGAEDLRSQLEKIGFNVEVELYDRATVVEKRSQKEGWAIHLTYFSVWNADPQVWGAWVGTNGWITNWDDENSKKMDEIFAKMLVELDQDARYKLVQDWYNTFWEYVPYVKTIDYSRMNATNAKLQGYANYCQPFFWNTWVEE